MKQFIFFVIFCIFGLGTVFCCPTSLNKNNYEILISNIENSTNKNLDGQWKFSVEFSSIGKVEFLITIKTESDTSFTAFTRQKALKDIVGFNKYILNQLFSNKFPKGSLIHVKNGKIINDNQLKGIFISAVGNFDFNGKIANDEIIGTLSNKAYSYEFVAIPHPSNYINYDYGNLITEMINTCKKNIYNPEILNRHDWRKFFNYFNKSSSLIHDDLEMIFAFYYKSQNLKTSHVYLAKKDVLAAPSTATDSNDFKDFKYKYVNNNNAAYLKFSHFSLNDTVEVRNFINQLVNINIPDLIIDLRGCGGGDFSSMLLASYFIEKPLPAGYFLGNKYFNTTNKLPSQEFLQETTPFSGFTLDDFINEVTEKGILVGKVFPDKLHYTGNIYVLTDNYTASAAEPLVYFLKNHNIATIIGEKTAGAMLSATTFNFKDDWHIVLPVADYYTSDNKNLDQVGVTPHKIIKSSEALDFVLNMIK
ncbi:MAG: S41 family peptidase [Bacteroidales bacterium]